MWGRADLHMHTTVSDGLATVHEMLDYASQYCKLDVVAITDHDRLDASLWAYYHQDRYPFEIVPGVEVTSADGHVLALWVTEPIPKGMSLTETAAAIHAQKGVAIVAHPMEPTIAPKMFTRYLMEPGVLIQSGIDAVEIFNAGAITPGNNWLAERLLGKCGLAVVGNSDAHMPSSIASGVTRFNGTTAAELRESLALGCTTAEGKTWPITTYWKLLRNEMQRRRNASLARNRHSVPQTRPPL